MVIGYGMGGFSTTIAEMLATPSQAPLLTRERVSPLYFFSYMFIPFSAIAFPHIGIFCLTAKRLSHFKHTAIAYPLCLMAIWLPSTILGVVANRATEVPAIERKIEARQMLATPGASLTPDQRSALRRQADGEDVVIQMLHYYAPVWLAGLLGRGHHGRGDVQRLADPRAVDDVHRGRVRALRRQAAVRRGGAGDSWDARSWSS